MTRRFVISAYINGLTRTGAATSGVYVQNVNGEVIISNNQIYGDTAVDSRGVTVQTLDGDGDSSTYPYANSHKTISVSILDNLIENISTGVFKGSDYGNPAYMQIENNRIINYSDDGIAINNNSISEDFEDSYLCIRNNYIDSDHVDADKGIRVVFPNTEVSWELGSFVLKNNSCSDLINILGTFPQTVISGNHQHGNSTDYPISITNMIDLGFKYNDRVTFSDAKTVVTDSIDLSVIDDHDQLFFDMPSNFYFVGLTIICESAVTISSCSPSFRVEAAEVDGTLVSTRCNFDIPTSLAAGVHKIELSSGSFNHKAVYSDGPILRFRVNGLSASETGTVRLKIHYVPCEEVALVAS